jgi:hypothetical protein
VGIPDTGGSGGSGTSPADSHATPGEASPELAPSEELEVSPDQVTLPSATSSGLPDGGGEAGTGTVAGIGGGG